MTIAVGTRVVAVHPRSGYPVWGRVGFDSGPSVLILQEHIASRWAFLVPEAIVHVPGDTPYPDDGIGDYYWRLDQEIEAERKLHVTKDPQTRGPFRPKTLID